MQQRLGCCTTMGLRGTVGSCLLLIILIPCKVDSGNPDAKRLYDDLLSNYNKLVRPVANVTEAVTVHLKLKLSQLIAVNLKNQIMTTNLWVEQFWLDYKLQWNPDEYGGVNMLHVPSDHIWRPDIVLYNNADGNFEVTLATKATLYHTGAVEWKPPAIYHSSCEMDVEYFPFDEQTCVMKFGSWTYDGFQVDLRHEKDLIKPQGPSYGAVATLPKTQASTFDRNAPRTPPVEVGIDLTEFYMSVEWDILEVPAIRNVKYYTCCDEPYLDITFNITMRRKTLFYTVNLIIPCMGISFLTILVFYLPSDSGEKVSLSISILLSLTVFFLLLAEIIPPTSLVVPLLGKFVLFTMILDTFSICVTVVVLNVHFRTPQTHTMAPWVRRVFIHILPRLLAMKRPQYEKDRHRCDLLKSPYFSFTTEDNYYAPEENELTEDEFNAKQMAGRRRGPEATNKIVVRTCNGIEVRKSPYESGFSDQHSLGASSPGLGKHYGWAEGGGRHKTPELHRRHCSPEMQQFTDLYHTRPRSAQSNHSMGNSLGRKKQNRPDVSGPGLNGSCKVHGHSKENVQDKGESQEKERLTGCESHHLCPEILKALDGILFIAEHKKKDEESTKIIEDWKYVAMVMDRLFLWIFTVAVLVGTAGIILQAPTLYDDRDPIDYRVSEIGLATSRPMAGAYKERPEQKQY